MEDFGGDPNYSLTIKEINRIVNTAYNVNTSEVDSVNTQTIVWNSNNSWYESSFEGITKFERKPRIV